MGFPSSYLDYLAPMLGAAAAASIQAELDPQTPGPFHAAAYATANACGSDHCGGSCGCGGGCDIWVAALANEPVAGAASARGAHDDGSVLPIIMVIMPTGNFQARLFFTH